MRLPEMIQNILSRLQEEGFSAFAVGGCVRDTLLGKEPKDWDLCTSATPVEMKQVFSDEHVVETGLKHGTLTLVINHIPYEITTYRTEGSYTDHRHPDCVFFVDRVEDDLARRDFTINAMACGKDGIVLDPFDGKNDLNHRLIRCVGEPEKRFEEDALRILRALRFASVLDFSIHPDTDQAIRTMYPTMGQVAGERVRAELLKLLCGAGSGRILREYTDVITFLVPCLKPEVGFDQNNPHHRYTVWEHTIRAVENIPPDPDLRMTMLLHDCGKPFTRTTDIRGIGHYKGHQDYSAKLAEEALDLLRFDRVSRERIIKLVKAHDVILSTEKRILLKRLHQYGERDIRALFLIHCADRIATGTRNPEHAKEHCQELNDALDALLAEDPCFTLKDLKVNGQDMMLLGFRNREIGDELNWLLEMVMDGRIENTREELIKAAKEHAEQTAERKMRK